MRLQTEGLIIKETNIGESDKLLTLLTREKGVIRAFASGARRFKNKNASATALFCYSHFTLFKHKDTYRIDEATHINLFYNLRKDIESLSLAGYFCELAGLLAPEETEADEYLRLTLNSLHFLANKSKPAALLKAVTELKMLAISGYMPDLVACNNCCCECNNTVYFNLLHGCLVCKDCFINENSPNGLTISPTVLAAMRHIIYCDFSKLYSFSIPEESLKELSDVTERYVLIQTEHKFKTLEFYKSLFI